MKIHDFETIEELSTQVAHNLSEGTEIEMTDKQFDCYLKLITPESTNTQIVNLDSQPVFYKGHKVKRIKT